MNRLVFTLACAAGAVLWVPGAAPAALSLQIGPSRGGYDGPPIPPQFDVPLPLDLIFHETGGVQREGLFSYDVALDLLAPGGSGPLGVRLVTGPSAVQLGPNPTIARTDASGNPAEPSVTILESTPQRLVFNVTSPGALSDIDEGETAGRIFYTYHAGGRPFDYHIVADPVYSVFGSGDPELAISIDVAFPDVGRIFYPPEPSSLSLLAMAGLMGLRWRRAG